jgi:hypothetical protein
MHDPFFREFTLKDGTEVQVRKRSDECYEFILLSPDKTEDTFTWDANEARDIQKLYGLSDIERRRTLALQELWKLLAPGWRNN